MSCGAERGARGDVGGGGVAGSSSPEFEFVDIKDILAAPYRKMAKVIRDLGLRAREAENG